MQRSPKLSQRSAFENPINKVDSFKKGRRMIEDYPDHSKMKLDDKKWLDWEQTINN